MLACTILLYVALLFSPHPHPGHSLAIQDMCIVIVFLNCMHLYFLPFLGFVRHVIKLSEGEGGSFKERLHICLPLDSIAFSEQVRGGMQTNERGSAAQVFAYVRKDK